MKLWAAIFPGQGSQHVGMGKEIFDNFKVAKEAFEEASEAVKIDLKRLCFDSSDSDLKLTANTQPALLITSYAAWLAFCSETDARPSVAMGHSLGEYSALLAAGALSLAEAINAVRVRGLAMQDAVPVGTGGMVAVLGMEDSAVVKACHDLQSKAATSGGLKNCVLEAANFNSPGQVVVSGHQKALDYMKEHLVPSDYGASRAKLIPLAVSAPFHCSLMKPAAERLKPVLEKIKWSETLKFDLVHNSNGEQNHNGTVVKNLLYEQMTKPVLWSSSVRLARHMSADLFVEFGAGKILSGLVKKIDSAAHTFNVDGVENLKISLNETRS